MNKALSELAHALGSQPLYALLAFLACLVAFVLLTPPREAGSRGLGDPRASCVRAPLDGLAGDEAPRRPPSRRVRERLRRGRLPGADTSAMASP